MHLSNQFQSFCQCVWCWRENSPSFAVNAIHIMFRLIDLINWFWMKTYITSKKCSWDVLSHRIRGWCFFSNAIALCVIINLIIFIFQIKLVQFLYPIATHAFLPIFFEDLESNICDSRFNCTINLARTGLFAFGTMAFMLSLIHLIGCKGPALILIDW